MNKTINEIVKRLKKYPETDYKVDTNSIIVHTENENGFPVSLIDNGNGNFTVEYDFWHEEFESEKEAISCFGYGLSNECRLKVQKRGNKRIKWTLQFDNNGNWENESTVAIFDFRFWKKSEYEYLQNNLTEKI
tara:strand:+ start:15 stop:413 length:399 start_codon:yes stop_codon:yes gene_type:complete